MLIERSITGDFRAFEEIVNRYENQVYDLGRRMLRNEEDARDILQETFLSVSNNLHKLKKKLHLSTWIYRIAMNHCLMRLRKEKWDTISLDVDVMGLDTKRKRGYIDESAKSPVKLLEDEELKKEVKKTKESLPPKYKTVLGDTEDFSIKEIAEKHGISVSAVRSRLHRARKIVREKLLKQLLY